MLLIEQPPLSINLPQARKQLIIDEALRLRQVLRSNCTTTALCDPTLQEADRELAHLRQLEESARCGLCN